MSEFRTTEATNEAVEHVLNNLWSRGEEELSLLEISHSAAAQFILARRAEGAPTFAFWADDEPLFVTGLVWSDNGRGMNTWFQATHRFPLFFREITRHLRAGLEAEARRNDLDFMEVFSVCVHERTGRWFRSLGFELDLDYHFFTNRGTRMYRFVRNFKGSSGVLQ